MVLLSQLYKLTKFNEWVVATLPSKVHDKAMKLEVVDQEGREMAFRSTHHMKQTIFKYERKLTPE